MIDHLAQFRKSSAVPPDPESAPELEPGGSEYRAFYPVDKEPKCLSIYSSEAWVHENYAYLQYVTEDAGRGRKFCIIYGFMVVEVKGRNLKPVVHAIKSGNCAFIQEFDAGKWKHKPDAGAPIIDAIEFHHGAEKRGEMLPAKQKKAEAEEA